MDQTPVLMENTKIGTFSLFREGSYKRNRNFRRPIFAADVTPDMEKSAGLDVGTYSTEAAPVKTPKPVKAPRPIELTETKPEAEIPIEVVEGREARPDFSDWDEDKLRAFTEERDIPTHPNARVAGLQAAITRYFSDLEIIGDG